eukprot:scaffold14813_cov173-Skeletonema_dohrnii-CCMP3373.AAC.2
MNRRVRVHNRSNGASPCSFPIMKVLTLMLVLTPIFLANQNLAAVKSPPVFITADARSSILEPTSPTDELFENRFDHIKTEWMKNNPYSLRVFVTEGTNNRYDYINSTDNPDEINSVKNRKHKHSTTEYLNGESELHEGTHHLFPILLRILVGFNNNNNTDANFIAFKLPSSLAQGYQLTDTVLLLTTMISMFYVVEFAVVIETLYGERRDSHDTPISGEHPAYDGEDDGPFVSINVDIDVCISHQNQRSAGYASGTIDFADPVNEELGSTIRNSHDIIVHASRSHSRMSIYNAVQKRRNREPRLKPIIGNDTRWDSWQLETKRTNMIM